MLIIIILFSLSCRPIACNFIKKEALVQVRTPAFSSFIFDLFWLQKQPFADVLQNSYS